MSLCFLDCETTGTNPEHHSVWEIGVVTDSGEYGWVLELTPEELAVAEPMALSVGRYYERSTKARDDWGTQRVSTFTRDPSAVKMGDDPNEHRRRVMREDLSYIRKDQRSMLAEFLAIEIGTSHLVGAVPSFDARFVGDFMRAQRFVPSWHYHLVDVEALAAGKLGIQPPWKSKALYRELDLNSEWFDEHTALGDARMAKAVYELAFGLPSSYPEALYGLAESSQEK